MSTVEPEEKRRSITATIAIPHEAIRIVAPSPDTLSQRNVEAVTGIPARIYLEAIRRPGFPLHVSRLGKLRIVNRVAFVAWIEGTGLLAEMSTKLRRAGHDAVTPEILKRAAVRDGNALEEVRRAVDMIAAGEVVEKRKTPTIRELCERWTSGELAAQYRDRIKLKHSVRTDICWLRKYVYPVVGDVAIEAFTLDHAESVMEKLPEKLAGGSRRHIAQLIHRICALATFPLRLIPHNPVPRGFVQHEQKDKAKGWIYPDEETKLVACTHIPLCWRIFYAFLHREGMRRSEALSLSWSDLDLHLGAITLDINKTNDPRAWALSPGVVAALMVWRERCARSGIPVEGDALVFVEERGPRKYEGLPKRETAARYRSHLRMAGITRRELFVSSDARMSIRLHDTRATFITLALANGKSEPWVQDRTGHRSSDMINRYRRVARTAAELGLGELLPMNEAIPECSGKSRGFP